MVGKDGKQYENRIVNELNDTTGPNVRAIPCGYSGSHKGPSADFVVTTNNGVHAVELKKTSQDTFRVETDDLEQIRACANIHTRPYIAIKYTHRELMVTGFGSKGGEDGRKSTDCPTSLMPSSNDKDGIVADTPKSFNPRYGRTGTYITDKPSLDDWDSSRGGRSDIAVLMDELDIDADQSQQKFDIQEAKA